MSLFSLFDLYYDIVFFFCFFFFQAEDGIRDWSVTGVQTCALPILSPIFAWLWVKLGPRQPSSPAKFALALLFVGLAFVLRSEEHTSELQSLTNLVCRLLLEKKKKHKTKQSKRQTNLPSITN